MSTPLGGPAHQGAHPVSPLPPRHLSAVPRIRARHRASLKPALHPGPKRPGPTSGHRFPRPRPPISRASTTALLELRTSGHRCRNLDSPHSPAPPGPWRTEQRSPNLRAVGPPGRPSSGLRRRHTPQPGPSFPAPRCTHVGRSGAASSPQPAGLGPVSAAFAVAGPRAPHLPLALSAVLIPFTQAQGFFQQRQLRGRRHLLAPVPGRAGPGQKRAAALAGKEWLTRKRTS